MTTAQHTPAPQPGDAELLALCRQGDDQAFEVLYNRYRLPLFSYLHRLLPGRADVVDDIFQQTWLKATQNLGRYTDQQRFLASARGNTSMTMRCPKATPRPTVPLTKSSPTINASRHLPRPSSSFQSNNAKS